MIRTRFAVATFLVALACSLGACSKTHTDTFIKCPDGVVDNPFEQCDDGNSDDKDDCLTDCKLPFCGDTVAHVQGTPPFEECDAPDLAGATCESLGFAAGPLTCTSTCLFDTSQCGPTLTPTSIPTDTPTPTVTPTVTPTPMGGAPTSTATSTPSATPTATPTLGACVPGEGRRLVQVSFSAPSGEQVSAIKILASYPQTALSLPTPPALGPRIGGRQNNVLYIPNLGEEGLTVTVSRTGSNLTQGNLFTINFDECVGAPPPPISAFTCSIPLDMDGVPECGSSFGPVQGCECAISEP